MSEVLFWKKASYALLPDVSAPPEVSEKDAVSDPVRRLSQIGWVLRSPVDILMTPIRDVDVAFPEGERDAFATATGLHEHHPIGWEQGPIRSMERFIVSRQPAWARQYEVDIEGARFAMFYPLGQGFFEWRLGIGVGLPEQLHLMALPISLHPGLEIAGAILSHVAVGQANANLGLVVACRAEKQTHVTRGAPIARILAIHSDTIGAKATTLAYQGETHG